MKFEKELRINKKIKAVGEIGLDYSTNASRSAQKELLCALTNVALTVKLPIVIHCRESKFENLECTQDCINILKENLPSDYPLYKHCLINESEVAVWTEHFPNIKFGINALLFSNRSLQKLVASTDIDKLFIETDSPFLAGNFNQNYSLPRHIFDVAAEISRLRKTDICYVTDAINDSTKNFFSLIL